MSVNVSATRMVAGLRAEDPVGSTALPESIKDAQGRVFNLQTDPVTQHAQYKHSAVQRDPTGSQLDLEILIDLAPDGSYTRRTTQSLALASGDTEREVQVASYGANGVQTGETVDSSSKEGNLQSSEHTVGTFAGGVLVKRETDVTQAQEQTDPATRERQRIEVKVHGVWDDGGKPITNSVVPTIERTHTERIDSPGKGINKDTDRSLSFVKHSAGTPGAIVWEPTGTLFVRFEGHKGQYIERELSVPVDAQGNPSIDKATEVRTTDNQSLVTKGMTKARVLGGLVSNISWIVGLNLRGSSLGKGILAFSAAAAGASLAGEGHAIVTRRNDADLGRLIMAAYDTLLTGALAAYLTGGRKSLSMPTGVGTGFGAGFLVSASNNSRELVGGSPIGADGLMQRTDAIHGLKLLAAPASSRDEWRAEPRFDAGRALLAA